MELGLREWLIIIGVVVLLLVIGDGLRQMRRRGARLKMKIGDGVDLKNLPEEDPTCGGELVGGARVITPESADGRGDAADRFGDGLDGIGNFTSDADGERAGDGAAGFSAVEPDEVRSHSRFSARRDQACAQMPSADAQQSELPMVIAISVLADDGQRFSGPQILQSLLAAGLQFGDMDIFHCHERENGFGAVLFSVANAVQPGTFDLDRIDDMVTPGLSFFMELRGNPDPQEALQRMLETGHYLSKMLNGRLCDDRRRELTAEWTAHQREITARAAGTTAYASA